MPRHHLPGAVPFGVNVDEPGFEFVVTNVELGMTGDHGSVLKLADFYIFSLDGFIVGFSHLDSIYEAGFRV